MPAFMRHGACEMPAVAIDTESAAPLENKKHGAPGGVNGAGWYILRATPGRDFDAEEALQESGWDIFSPREYKWRPARWRRKPAEAEAGYPRFPGYLFIAVCPPRWPDFEAWPFVQFVRGVLCMDGRPARLAAGEIERLRAADGQHVPHVASVPVRRALAAGDRVRVVGGAFRDFVAALDAVDARGAHLSIQLFGRPTDVVLPLTWVEHA